ncbi:fumarate reductase flavo protein subunit [Cadophora sp. DSE1049]|nr:fumarate reductase flavo protein subunit [Cadophora sp. DSE1049]
MAPLPHFTSPVDVLVIGSGNAGFTAATQAAEAGVQRVVLIDKCPPEWAGGNSFFTAGAFRTVHNGTSDLLPIVNNVTPSMASLIDLEPYTPADFRTDMDRMTSGRTDPSLSEVLISESNAAVKWLAKQGIRFQLSFNRQAYKVNGRFKFWGGMSLKTDEGGKGLIQDHQNAALRHGVEIYYSTAAKRIITDPATGTVSGVVVEVDGIDKVIQTKAVILAAGGFEANPRMRSQFLGPGWDLARVRGTPFNTGEALEFAIRDVNAKQAGNWSGCHSTCWDANAPANSGDRAISNEFTKSGYPLGLMLNNRGERFVDEGVDMRNFTYARFGRAIHGQPEGVAFQVWDQRAIPWLRDEEYRDAVVEKIWGETLEELAENCAKRGLEDPASFVSTIQEYNAAVEAAERERTGSMKWDPAVKDGLSTQSSTVKLALPKSNWALPVTQGPFMAVKVCCGITFTFGGLAIDPKSTAVISQSGKEVKGLFAVGEMVGGLFYGNYPGGSGLTSGAVFGRRAGMAAAKLVGASRGSDTSSIALSSRL